MLGCRLWTVMNKAALEQRSNIQSEAPELRSTAERIVARSFYKELRESGYTTKELLAVSAELIDLVTHDLKKTLV